MIKYKYLRAWDMMMHSSQSWIELKQKQAEEEDAPIDAIYRDVDGTWHRFSEVVSEDTKEYVQKIVNSLH